MFSAFDSDIYVPNIKTLSEAEIVVQKMNAFTPIEHQEAFNQLRGDGIDSLDIGVKKLIMLTEMASQDVDKTEKFVSSLSGLPHRSY